MGRINSTEALKPHEIALRKLSMEKDVIDLILTTLGLGEQSVEKFQHLLTTGKVKQLEEGCYHFTPEDFSRLPEIKQEHQKNRVSGQWVIEDEYLRISNKNGYTQKLNDAVINIYPDFMGDEETIPVTILLPSAVKQDVTNLEGTYSDWDFITVNNFDFIPKKQNPPSKNADQKSKEEALVQQAKSTFPLRLFFAFNFLGLVNVQQPARNGSRIFLELARSLHLTDQFNLLDGKELRAWIKDFLKLDNQRQIQHEKISEVFYHYSSLRQETGDRHRSARKKEIQARINELEDKLEACKRPEPISSETKNSFYYTIPPSFFEQLKWETGLTPTVIFPTLTLKKKQSSKYTTVCLGHIKDNDVTSLLRDTDKMRHMLCYLCSMTSGTAITFNVKRAEYKGSRKTMGISSPTLILPEVWSDLAMGLKQHNSKSKVSSMSDDDYSSDSQKADFTSAIHGDYLTKQDELLRLLPTDGKW